MLVIVIICSGCIKAPKEAVLNPSDESQLAIPISIPDPPTLNFDEALPEEINLTEYFNVSIFFESYYNGNLSVLIEVPNNILNSSDIKIKCNQKTFNVTDYYLSDVYTNNPNATIIGDVNSDRPISYNSYYFDINCTYKQQGYVVFHPYNVSFFVLDEGNGWTKNVTKI